MAAERALFTPAASAVAARLAANPGRYLGVTQVPALRLFCIVSFLSSCETSHGLPLHQVSDYYGSPKTVMPNPYSMSPILTNRLKNHIDSDIKDLMYTDDCGEDAQIYTRGIVAICLAGLSGDTYANVAVNITDGSKDNGIDGVLYDAARNKLFIVQSKWSNKGTGTIDTGDLRKFVQGVYDLLNEEWAKFNGRFKPLSNSISVGIRRDPEIVLVVAYNSDNPVSSECQSIIDDFLAENNSDGQELVTFQSFRLKHLVRETLIYSPAGAPAAGKT